LGLGGRLKILESLKAGFDLFADPLDLAGEGVNGLELVAAALVETWQRLVETGFHSSDARGDALQNLGEAALKLLDFLELLVDELESDDDGKTRRIPRRTRSCRS
jgi:hypothetical protein